MRPGYLASLVFVAITIGSSPALADNGGCANGRACVWTGKNFNGAKGVLGPHFGGNEWKGIWPAYSAKNRFGARNLKLRKHVSGFWLTWCLRPGDNIVWANSPVIQARVGKTAGC
jgi:hypothetical protein